MIVIAKEINTTPPRKLWYDWKAKYSIAQYFGKS